MANEQTSIWTLSQEQKERLEKAVRRCQEDGISETVMYSDLHKAWCEHHTGVYELGVTNCLQTLGRLLDGLFLNE